MDSLAGLRFLVTGGGGFIGSNLVRHLLDKGPEVVRVLDDFSTGRRENLAPVASAIELLEGDICDGALVERAVEGIDYVLHQAAIPSVPRSVEEPERTTAVIVAGTVTVLAKAVRAGVKRVVVASSSSVYGDSDVLPKHEDMPLNPLSPYAAGKGACELLCRSFHQVYRLETVCLRYFNIFGPRQDPNSQYAAVIPKFITELAANRPLPIFGDGLQSRDFTYVGNVVDANILACFAQNAPGRTFNIGCGEQVTLLELADVLGRLMGCALRITHLPSRAGDVRHSLADITRAREILGYAPSVDLETGLRRTISHFVASKTLPQE